MFGQKDLKGKKVVVLSAGVEYRGKVVEMGVDALVLSSASGFTEIPWEKVTKIEEEGQGDPIGLGDRMFPPFPIDFDD